MIGVGGGDFCDSWLICRFSGDLLAMLDVVIFWCRGRRRRWSYGQQKKVVIDVDGGDFCLTVMIFYDSWLICQFFGDLLAVSEAVAGGGGGVVVL